MFQKALWKILGNPWFISCLRCYPHNSQAGLKTVYNIIWWSNQMLDLPDTFLAHSDLHDNCINEQEREMWRGRRILVPWSINKSDPELVPLLQEGLRESEAAKVPTCFYMSLSVLMRKCGPTKISPDEEWQMSHQTVAPSVIVEMFQVWYMSCPWQSI